MARLPARAPRGFGGLRAPPTGGGSLRLEGDWAEAKDMLKDFKKRVNKAGFTSTRRLAILFQEELELAYERGTPPPLSRGAVERRLQGKRAGARPAVPTFPPGPPLHRSGTLAKSIRMSQLFRRFTVHVAPLTHAGQGERGGFLPRIAALHEQGGSFTIPLTFRARAYLSALREGVAGQGASAGGGSSKQREGVARTITVNIPPRPRWSTTFEAIRAHGPKAFATIFLHELELQGVKFHGGASGGAAA